MTVAQGSKGNVIHGEQHSKTTKGGASVCEEGKFWRTIECCGGLNDDNSSHRLIYLNVLSPVGVTVWERLRDLALLE